LVNAGGLGTSISQGDRISVFASDVDGAIDPRDILGEAIVSVITLPNGSGGQQYGD